MDKDYTMVLHFETIARLLEMTKNIMRSLCLCVIHPTNRLGLCEEIYSVGHFVSAALIVVWSALAKIIFHYCFRIIRGLWTDQVFLSLLLTERSHHQVENRQQPICQGLSRVRPVQMQTEAGAVIVWFGQCGQWRWWCLRGWQRGNETETQQ